MDDRRQLFADYFTARLKVGSQMSEAVESLCDSLGRPESWRDFPNIRDCHELSADERKRCRSARKLGKALYVLYGYPNYVWIEAKGEGCREIERSSEFDWSLGQEEGWRKMLGRLRCEGFVFTRIDLALDDRDGLLDLSTIEKKSRSKLDGEWCGTLRRARSTRGDGGIEAMQFGLSDKGVPTPKSIKLYDKARQKGESDHWVRMELQAREREAAGVATAFIDLGGTAIRSRINFMLSFRDRVKKERGAGCKFATSPWWTSFLHDPPAHRRREPEPLSRFDELLTHLGATYGPTLAALLSTPRGVIELGEIARGGRKRLKVHQLQEIRETIMKHQQSQTESLHVDALQAALAEIVGPWLYILGEARSLEHPANSIEVLSRTAADRLGMTVERHAGGLVLRYRTIKEGQAFSRVEIVGPANGFKAND